MGAAPTGTHVVYALRDGHVEPPGGLRRDAHDVGAHAVVAVAEGDDVELPRVEARQHHGQVIGLGPAVDEVHHLRHGSARQCAADADES